MAMPSTDAVAHHRAASKRKLQIAIVVMCLILMTMIVAYSERDILLPVRIGKVM